MLTWKYFWTFRVKENVLLLLLFFWLCRVACGILVPRPGIEPRPMAVKALSPNRWTTREFPRKCIIKMIFTCSFFNAATRKCKITCVVCICGSHYISIGQRCSRGNGEVRKYERLAHLKRNWVNLGHFQLWLQVGLSDWTNFSRCFLLLGGVEIVKKTDSVLENEEATFSWLVGWRIEPLVFVLKWRDWRTPGHLGSWRHLKIEYSLGRW